MLELLLSYVSCDGMNRHGRNKRRINEAMLKISVRAATKSGILVGMNRYGSLGRHICAEIVKN